VEKEYSPTAKIGIAIICAAEHCRDRAKVFIAPQSEEEGQQREIVTFYEFLYFFMHMSNRQAFRTLTEAHIEKLHSSLGPLISAVAIDAYFAHWPTDLKDKMRGEFYEKLNVAELEYTDATRVDAYKEVPWGSPVPLVNLFLRLGSNIAALTLDDAENEQAISSVSDFAFTEWSSMGLEDLMFQVRATET
jgi:hypothetical protein